MVKNALPSGLFIELLEYFAEAHDWQIEYVEGSWNDHLASLARAELDILPAVGFTDARRSIYDFNRLPVYTDSGVLFTGRKTVFETIFDLDGLRVAGVRGSIFTTSFPEYIRPFGIDCEIVFKNTNEEVMQAIVDGSVDAGVTIYSLGRELQKRFRVQITPINFSPIPLKYAVPKGRNGDVLKIIDAEMDRMIGDPSSFYNTITHRWMEIKDIKGVPSWIWWGFSGLGMLAAIVGLWGLTLRHEVKIKTEHLRVEIEERKNIEKEVRKLNTELEAKVRERTSQLTYANEELESFTYSIAHDLRAPLRLIAGFAQILTDKSKLCNDPDGVHCVERIMHNSTRMDELIKGILGFSHVTKSRLSCVPVDMTGMAKSVFEEVVPPEERGSITLVLATLPVCEADPMLMHQVWINLIGNAVKYTRPKPLRRIEISGRTEEGMHVFEIRDSGVGFDPAYRDKLFKIFQRLHGEKEFEGTGVGLSIVERIVSRHHGKVWADAVPGEGALFGFSIPVSMPRPST